MSTDYQNGHPALFQPNDRCGVLSEREIKKLKIIEDGVDSCYQLSSYDLRLGSCHYVFNNSSEGDTEPGWTLIHIGSEDELSSLNDPARGHLKYQAPKLLRHTLTIPPYGSAIVELKETVDTFTAATEENVLIVGRFDLKLSQVYQALISQQATQVEPLYLGKLYCFIHNLSDKCIYLRENDKVATIEFSYAGTALSEEDRRSLIKAAREKNIEKYRGSKYSGKKKLGISEVRWFYEQNRLPADCGLNRLYSRIAKELDDATQNFDNQFDNYFEKEDTLTNIANHISDRLQSQHKAMELLVAVVTGVISLGVGALIWMFYQELVRLMEQQEFLLEYINRINTTSDGAILTNSTSNLFSLPWLLSFVVLMILVIVMVCGAYKAGVNKSKEDSKNTHSSKKLAESAKKSEEKLEELLQCYDALLKEYEKKRKSRPDENESV